MKKLLIVVLACYALTARSQVNESRNFMYLYSDSVVYAQKIRLRPDFLGSWALRADSRRVPIEQVKFFNNEDGFFANTRNLNFFREVSFAERIIEGRISLYQQTVYEPVPFEADYYRFRDRRRQVVDTRMFYNKGFSDLKKVNYYNLSTDMADNPKSIDLLKSYRKSMNTGTVMYVAAGAAVVAGLVSFISKGRSELNSAGNGGFGNGFSGNHSTFSSPNFTASFLLLGIGTGLGIGGYLIQASGARNIERAVDAYNH